jgi:hypothetical protein
MIKRTSATEWVGSYTPVSFFRQWEFCFGGKIRDETSSPEPTFDLLDYETESFDKEQIRMAIIRAKQDYGKAFEKLAAED